MNQYLNPLAYTFVRFWERGWNVHAVPTGKRFTACSKKTNNTQTLEPTKNITAYVDDEAQVVETEATKLTCERCKKWAFDNGHPTEAVPA